VRCASRDRRPASAPGAVRGSATGTSTRTGGCARRVSPPRRGRTTSLRATAADPETVRVREAAAAIEARVGLGGGVSSSAATTPTSFEAVGSNVNDDDENGRGGVERFRCEACGRTFDGDAALRAHLYSVGLCY
jgi:hypothetical protein